MVTIRDMALDDLDKGFFETLASLTDVGFDSTSADDILKASEVFIGRAAHRVLTYVAIKDGKVVGTLSLVPDMKYIHGGSLVYHLEDVVVHKAHQGKGIGQQLINHAINQATLLGAYKIILNCYASLVDFYAKGGFHPHDLCLRLDLSCKT